MRFCSVEIENFLSIEEARLVFEEGVHVVQGRNWDMSTDGDESNGAGKSSIWEAPEWALWGTLSRSGNARADDVINREAGKNCLVKLTFNNAGKRWEVLRTRKHDTYGTCLRWWVNGEEQTKHDSRETARELADSLPLSHQVYRYAIQVGQGMPDRFLSLSETQKQTLLSEIIDLVLYDQGAEIASAKVTETEAYVRTLEEIRKVTEAQVESLTAQAEAARSAKDEYLKSQPPSESIEALDEAIELAIQARDKAREAQREIEESWREEHAKAELIRAEIDKVRDLQKGELETRRTEIFARVDLVADQHDAIAQEKAIEASQAEEQWDSYVQALRDAAVDPSTKVTSLESTLAAAVKERKGLQSQPVECPTCKRPIDVSHLSPRIEELIAYEKTVQDALNVAKEEKQKAQGELSAGQLRAKTAKDQWAGYLAGLLPAKQAAVAEVRKECDEELKSFKDEQTKTLEADLDRYQIALNKVSQIQQPHAATKKAGDDRQEDIDTLHARKNAVLSRLQEHQRRLAQFDERVSFAGKQVKEYKKDLVGKDEEIEKAKVISKHWKYWKQNIPNLRAAALSQILQYLNTRIAYYMSIFSGSVMGMDLIQTPYGKTSKIKVDLSTPGGSYDLSSGGERRRIDLTLYLALSDLVQYASGYSCNLLVADEIMDGLSPQGVGKLLDVLRQRAENGTCVYVVSHNPAVSQMFSFDSTIRVEKRNGKTRIK